MKTEALRAIQAPLKERYRQEPEAALVSRVRADHLWNNAAAAQKS